MANNLSLSNVINVTLVPSIAGLSEFNTANLLLYSTEQPITDFGTDIYRIYYNASSVAEDFGVNSLTYKMAVAVFSQTPNILSNSGALIIAPRREWESQAETFNKLKSKVLFCGWMTTDDIANDIENLSDQEYFAGVDANQESDSLETIQALTDPNFTIILNGEEESSSGAAITFDFSSALNLNDVAGIIKDGINNHFGTTDWVVDVNEGKFFMFCQDASVKSISLDDTELTQAIKLDSASNPSYGEYQQIAGLASVVNAENNKINFVVSNSDSDVDGAFTNIKDATLQKTRCLFYGGTETEAKIMMASYASKAMSTIFEASLTTQTMHLKPLTGVLPDPIMTETLLSKCKSAGVDTYVSIEGVPCVFSTGANGFFDEVFNELWFVNAIQTAGFNYLRQTGTKIPQTERGMDGLKNAYTQVCVRGINNGFLAQGTWTSSDTFGNPDTFKRNIETSGFYVYSTPVAQQSKADREDRKAPLVQIAIKTAGAIHSTNVMIYVNL